MHKRQLIFAFVSILFTASVLTAQSDWKARVADSMPLLGHRNWILIVDSAYPLQSSPGVETIETNASHLDVLQYVLGAVNNSIHVRPLITMDSELPYVPDDDAPGASAYRSQIAGSSATTKSNRSRMKRSSLRSTRPANNSTSSSSRRP